MKTGWTIALGAAIWMIAAPALAQEADAEASPDAASPAPPAAPPVSAEDEARLALARQIVARVIPEQPEQWVSTMLEAFTGPQIRAIRESDDMKAAFREMPRLRRVFDDFVEEAMAAERVIMIDNLPSLREASARSYTRLYSEAQLRDILAFFQTPTGQAFASRAMTMGSDPDIASWQLRVARLSRDRMQTLQASFMERLQTEVAKQTEGGN